MSTEKSGRTGPKKPLIHDPAMLRRRRYQLGMTQKTFAATVKMAESSISEFERGRRNPSPSTLTRLAVAFGCDPVELMPRLPVESA